MPGVFLLHFENLKFLWSLDVGIWNFWSTGQWPVTRRAQNPG